MNYQYIIIDWAHNHLFTEKVFNSISDASNFLLQQFPNDNDLQEYYIIKL
jgi:hypothetical protein